MYILGEIELNMVEQDRDHILSFTQTRSPYPKTPAMTPGGSKRCPNVSCMCSLVRAHRLAFFHTLLQAVRSMLFQINGSGSMFIACMSSYLKIRSWSVKWGLMAESDFSRKLRGTGSVLSLAHSMHMKLRMLHLIIFEWRNIGMYSFRFVGSACSIPIP